MSLTKADAEKVKGTMGTRCAICRQVYREPVENGDRMRALYRAWASLTKHYAAKHLDTDLGKKARAALEAKEDRR